MTHEQIESSILDYVVTGMAGEKIDINNPDQFDPFKEDISRWIEFNIETTRGVAVRRGVSDYRVRVSVIANSRSTTNLYDATRLIQECIDLLRQACIPVKDYSTSGDPVKGYAYFREETMDTVKTGGPEQWQIKAMTISAHVRQN